MRKIFFVLLFLVCGGVLLFSFSPSPEGLSAQEKKAAMAKILDREPVLTDKKATEWKVYKGKYLVFSYPAHAIVHKNAKLSSAIVESFQCSLLAERLNLTVQVSEGKILSDHAGVKLRQTQTDLYDQEVASVAGVPAIVFSKETEEGVEMTSFVAKEGRIYSFSVTGYQLKKVNAFYHHVVESVAF